MKYIKEYQTQSELNPKLWTNEVFNDKLRLQLLKIARAFLKFLDIKVKVKDVTLTGSNANYNWTKNSDIDLHLIINYNDIDENDTLVRELMQAKKSIWNNTYPLKYKDMNIELYAQDENEPHTSTGVYSLLKNNWIKKPKSDIVTVDDMDIDKKANPYKFEIDKLDPYEDSLLDKIKNLKDRLKKLRKTGLEREGEYSVENLAFKSLRNSGHLEKLSDLQNDAMLTQLTPTDENVLEAIVADKIECDKCNWSWKIVDGGNDLFMCHKCGHDNTPNLKESDPKKGTGKKPKGSGRRLYTDENPSDTVSVKFKTKQDVVDTLNKASFKSKSHKRQSQIINLIHQRLRVAVGRTKDPEKKKRLKSAFEYIKKKKEASKKKTQRMKNEQWPSGPFGKEHDYSDYGGPFGDRKHKTDFKKGPGRTPTKSIGYGRGEEEKEDEKITGYKLENFADGKVKGKSRPGRVKKSGASCKGSVTSLRRKAKKYGGEKGKMYHWCANMKSGRKKK